MLLDPAESVVEEAEGVEIGLQNLTKGNTPFAAHHRANSFPKVNWHVIQVALIVVGVTVCAVVSRVAVAEQMPWLNDEILFVNWLGYWFSQHALEYIFQWQHHVYPPMSPVFANPPLFPLLVGVALNLANPLGLDPLFASRLVSVVAGLLTCAVVTWTGYRVGGAREAVLTGGLLAVLPVAVVASATAYVEGLLALEVAGLLALLVEYRANPRRRVVVAAAVVSGFGILTKLTFLPFIAGTVLAVAIFSRQKNRRVLNLGLYLIVAFLVPVVAWSGARDPHHIAGVIEYVTKLRPNDGLTQTFPPWQRLAYFPIQAIGTLPDVVPAIATIGLLVAAWRRRPVDTWLAIVAGFAVLYLMFLFVAVGPSTRHNIAALEPLVAVGAGRTGRLLLDLIPGSIARALAMTVILGASSLPVLSLPPSEYNGFSNQLVGGPAGSLRYYLSGDGEGMDRVADWINDNTPPGTIIASVAQNYNLQNYLAGGRRMVAGFNYDPVEAAGARGASFVVLYASQIESGQETTLARSARLLKPREVIRVAGAPDIFIYDLSAVPRSRAPVRLTWSSYHRSPNGEVIRVTSRSSNDVEFRFQFVGPDLHWAGLLSNPFSVSGADRVALHLNVQSTSDSRLVYIDLLPIDLKPGEPYRRYVLPLAPVLMQGPQGPLDLEIPLEMFKWVGPSGKTVPAPAVGMNRAVQLRIGVDSHGTAEGRVEASRIAIVTLSHAVAPEAPPQ